jgi:TetR/AcrR family transcriptional regulator, cholesterol catabolism regulator
MTFEATESETGRAGRRPNENAIFTAALEEFSAKGFNGASMRDIAGRAGTSLSNLYNYVPAKADLLAHVLQNANDDLRAELTTAVEAAGASAAERLDAAVRAYVLWSARRQTAGVVAMSEFRYLKGELRSQVVAARDATQDIFTGIVDHGAATGEFRTPHPHEAARNIVLLCAALATWYHPGGGKSPEQIALEQCRLALAMVEAAAPA